MRAIVEVAILYGGFYLIHLIAYIVSGGTS